MESFPKIPDNSGLGDIVICPDLQVNTLHWVDLESIITLEHKWSLLWMIRFNGRLTLKNRG